MSARGFHFTKTLYSLSAWFTRRADSRTTILSQDFLFHGFLYFALFKARKYFSFSAYFNSNKKKERFSAKCFDDFNPRGFYLPGTFRLVIQDQSSTTDSLAKYLATIILSKERAAKNYRVRFTDSMRLFKNNSFQTRCVPHGVHNSTDCENKNIVRVSYADSTQKIFPRRGLFATQTNWSLTFALKIVEISFVGLWCLWLCYSTLLTLIHIFFSKKSLFKDAFSVKWQDCFQKVAMNGETSWKSSSPTHICFIGAVMSVSQFSNTEFL